jgi:hypothetical protein
MRRPRSRAGQIIIPALLLFPTLFLFVYLIYETAKLSREKIRHQFAMDAAVYVEMANYSDFLNRSAYVNGAFPMRIFEEGYGDFNAECEGKVANCTQQSYAYILFSNGAFPHLNGQYIDHHTPETNANFQGLGKWNIAYGYNNDGSPTSLGPQSNRVAAGINENPPNTVEPFTLFSLNDANHYWHSYPLATEIYKLWYQVYSLLGSVEDAQYQVLTRLTGGPPAHSFLVKSYWLNTGDQVSDASALAASFGNQLGNFPGSVGVLCQKTLQYCGNEHFGGTGLQPYGPVCSNPIVTLMTSAACAGDLNGGGSGLFQVVYVQQQMINNLVTTPHDGGLYPGLSLSMSWSYPQSNYFNVNWAQQFGPGGPKLHTTISLAGNSANTDGITPGVWPDPTPKFQVRQFP